MTEKQAHVVLFALIFFLILSAAISLMIGPFGWTSPFGSMDSAHGRGIFQYRLCRVILTIAAGSSLAASGASLQALFRNPLADPHLFGISGGAALGAALVIGFLSEQGVIMPSAGAMVGGLIAFLLVFFYMQTAKGEGLGHCLLVGVLINSIAAALITLFKTILPAHKTQSLLFWLVGNISVVPLHSLMLIIPLWLMGMTILWLIKGELEILSFGVEESRLLGINASRMIKIVIFANCILIGNVVAFAGMIGFLGLVVPHLVRLTVNHNLRIVLPMAAVSGAILLVLFDCVGRLSFFFLKSEIPTGALSALFLSPLLFFLLIERVPHD